MNCLESQNGENDSTCIDSGECIGDCDYDDIFYAVLLRGVVGAKANDGPKGKTKRIKHLVSSIKPDSWLQQHFHLKGTTLTEICCECVEYLWCEHMGQPGSEHGSEVDKFSRGGDSLDMSNVKVRGTLCLVFTTTLCMLLSMF